MKKKIIEWNIKMPWGNLAMISWGDSSNPPVLMIHGYMDSAATFSFLVEDLLDDHYYVAFDIPGHGKSDAFPPGPHVTQVHIVEVIRRIVDHTGWGTFAVIAHSMGIVIAAVYNTVYPGRISRMVSLDPGVSFKPYYELNYETHVWYRRYHYYYENNYAKPASLNPKLYKYDEIVDLVAKNRMLSKKQAEVVLSRSLVPVDNGLYRLSWEPRIKTITTLALSEDVLHHINLKNTPPMLVINSSEGDKNIGEPKRFSSKILEQYKNLNNCSVVNVTGHHDVHITSARELAGYVNGFLKKEFCDAHSKL